MRNCVIFSKRWQGKHRNKLRKSSLRKISAVDMKRVLFQSECEECSLDKKLIVTQTSGEVWFQGNEGKGTMHNIKEKVTTHECSRFSKSTCSRYIVCTSQRRFLKIVTLKVDPVILTDFQSNNLSSQLVRLSLGSLGSSLSVSHVYLNVLAKEVGIETQPVSGNVEATL